MIKNRHIFYVPGYEPAGPTFYEKLLLKHLSRFARLTNLAVKSVVSTQSDLCHRTTTELNDKESCSTLTYDILNNEQVLKSHTNISRWKFYLIMVYLTPKALWAALRASSRHVSYGPLVLFFPWLTFYLAVLLIWLICALLIAGLAQIFGSSLFIYAFVSIAAFGLFYLFDQAHQKYNISRMFHCGRFFGHGADPIQGKMSKRLDEFNEHICSTILLNKADEYVIVGHSLGSPLATRMTAKLIDDPRLEKKIRENKIHLVCMGSVYQLELGGQTHFDSREEVYRPLRDCENLSWTEVYAAFDPFCPQPMNPCDIKLAPDPASPTKPHFRSANFRKNLRQKKLNKLRKNLFWIHMQYMLSSDTAETFDYFKMITGKIPVTDYLRTAGKQNNRLHPDG